jgi:hypothetical protein
MSSFSIDTSFNPGDEIKIVFDISNEVPTTSGKTVHIVDLHEGTPHSIPEGEVTMNDYQNIQSQNIHWSNVRATYVEPGGWQTNENYFAGATSSDGAYNTNQVINQAGHETSAHKIASDISRTVDGVTYDDWYLPHGWELSTLYNLMSVLDPVIISNGGSKLRKNHSWAIIKNYWASQESSHQASNTPCVSMSFNPNSGGGGAFGRRKYHKFRVRAVRKEVTTDSVSVGDFYKGGVVYKVIEEGEGITPKTDLDIKIGYADAIIFSQDDLSNGYDNPGIELTLTDHHGSNPVVSFDYSNSNTGNYQWQTNVQIYKKVEEIVEQVQAGQKQTLAWSQAAQRWVTRYSFTPEYFSTYKTGFASFVKGKLYIHDDSNNKNYFYNGAFPTQVSYVENIEPSQSKVFMTHAVEGNAVPRITRFETIDNWTMNSDLLKDDYTKRESVFYADIFGDTNDPNVGDNSTYGDRLMKGTKLRGQYIKVFMTFRQQDLEVKHSNIGYITSKGHTTNGSRGGSQQKG